MTDMQLDNAACEYYAALAAELEPLTCYYCDEEIPRGQSYHDIYGDTICANCLEGWLEGMERIA